jgi:uncharacterized protein YdhG (YjbR/CyaY superfamily)
MKPEEKIQYLDVNDYIARQPEQYRSSLELIRKTIKKAAPKAIETVSYQMPVFRFHGILMWYAAYKDHYGFYPKEKAVLFFSDKLKDYDHSKGTIRFPVDKPLPLDLITEIVKFCVDENLNKAMTKELSKTGKAKK